MTFTTLLFTKHYEVIRIENYHVVNLQAKLYKSMNLVFIGDVVIIILSVTCFLVLLRTLYTKVYMFTFVYECISKKSYYLCSVDNSER